MTDVVARLERGTYEFSVVSDIFLEAWAEVILTDGRTLSTREAPVSLDWHVERVDRASFVLSLRFTNTGDAAVRVEQLRPLVSHSGFRSLPREKLLTSDAGWQSWSRAHLARPYTPNATSAPPPIRTPILAHRHADSEITGWMAVVQDGTGAACLIGFLAGTEQTGVIEILAGPAGHAIYARAETEGVRVAPGESLHSEPLLLTFGDEAALTAHYADLVARHMHARVPTRTPSGWCSWYQFGTEVTEADVRRNLTLLDSVRDELTVDFIQLDDGYEREVGDWLDIRETFPSGIGTLMRDIHARGFSPGLWIAPFLLSERSATYKKHPSWVVRDSATNEPIVAIQNWGCDNYALDTTHPDALAWLEEVLNTICGAWGVAYLKLDFLYAAALRGRRDDATLTGAQAYTRGMRLIRRVAGSRFLLGCGAPLVSSVGLVDGMRIGSDVAPYWSPSADPGAGVGPSTFNAVRATLTRAWMHQRWWLNDPDCVLAREDTQLTETEFRAWASVVALSGGMLVLGDDVAQLERKRVTLLARLFPSWSVQPTALPPLVDDAPQRVRAPVVRPWASWTIVGIANWTEMPRDACFDPAEWELPPSPYYLVDLSSGESFGPHSGPTRLGSLAVHEIRLLSVHAAVDRPSVIGSTGHVLGEAMDVLDEQWADGTLRIVLAPDSASAGFVVVAVPPAWRYKPSVLGPIMRESGNAALRIPFDPGSARDIQLDFEPVTA